MCNIILFRLSSSPLNWVTPSFASHLEIPRQLFNSVSTILNLDFIPVGFSVSDHRCSVACRSRLGFYFHTAEKVQQVEFKKKKNKKSGK